MKEVALGVAGHDCVHLGCADERRVEVPTKDMLAGVVGELLVKGQERLGGGGVDVELGFGLQPAVDVVQRCDKESAGAAGRVHDALVRLGVEHVDHQLDGTARGEILAFVAPKVGAHDLLVGRPFGVYIGAAKIVLGELGDHEGQGPVIELDLVARLEDPGEDLLHLNEEGLDSSTNGLSTRVIEGLGRPCPETALFYALFLIMHLGKDKVEELPECLVLGHPLVRVNVVVAAAERDPKHRRVGAAHASGRDHLVAPHGFVAHGPVTDRLEFHVKAGDLLVEEEELEPVGPQAIAAAFGLGHRGLKQTELFLGLVVVAHLHGALLALLGLLVTDDDAAQVLDGLLAAGLEDRDVHLLLATVHLHLEAGHHVVHRDGVLVKERPGDALTHLLFGRVLHRLVGDVVEDLALFERGDLALGVVLWPSAVSHFRSPPSRLRLNR